MSQNSVCEQEQGQENVLNQTAHLVGNYHKYYSFHSARCRVELLENRSFFHKLWIAQGSPAVFCYLDIGCNEGDLSLEMYKSIKSELPPDVEVRLYGIDIDSSLIALANQKISQSDKEYITFVAVNAADENDIALFRSIVGTYRMSLVSIFSTTMWIHVNYGDEGLQRFLQNAYSFCLQQTGAMLIEPQPGRCYTNAAKRLRKLGIEKPPYMHCVDKTKVHETITKLMQHESVGLQQIHCFGEEDWGRALLLFHNLDKNFLKDIELSSSDTAVNAETETNK